MILNTFREINYKRVHIYFFFFFLLYTGMFSSYAQTDTTLLLNKNLHLKSAFNGVYWSGVQNHFTNQNAGTNTVIQISGNGFFNASTLPFSFTNKIVQSQFLTDEVKNNAFKKTRQNTNSGFGLGYKYGAGFTTRFKKNEVGLELSSESITYCKYTKDLFGLLFFGNAQYENESINFSGTQVVNHDFNRARFIFSTITGVGDSSWQFNGSISYLQWYHVNLVSVGNTALFTAPAGEYLVLKSKFIYQTNDTTDISALAFNGNGIGVDVSIAFPAGKSQLFFSINDAGFIHWNKKSLQYDMDTLIRFEGVALENILVNEADSINNFKPDTILNYLSVNQSMNSFNINLPLRFSLVWNRLVAHDKIMVNAGFSFLPQYENSPLVFAATTFQFKNFYPSVSISYGGLQKFNMGVNLEGNILKHFNYLIGTGQMLSFVFPNSLTGVNLYSQISYSF